MLETILLLYGILGTTATLKPHFDKLRKRLSVEGTYEKVIFKCYRKAVKDVTGEDLSRFRLKGDVAILQKIDEYFSTDDVPSAAGYIDKFLSSLQIDFKEVRGRFEHHLKVSGSPEVLTHITLTTMKDTKEIKRTLSDIAEELKRISPPKERGLPKGIPTLPAAYFAHPYPLQKNFTGRDSERKELTEWFTKGEQPMFAYVAIGGMGKSALTWYWLQEDIIKGGLAPEGIIWWSFYDREASFDSFLRKSIQYASKGEIDAKEMVSVRNGMDTLYTLLSSNRFLLVLDGVERMLRAYAGLGSPYQGDEVKEDDRGDFRSCVEPNVGTFLQWLASGKPKTKTLLTTRVCPRELDGMAGCREKKLKEMDKEDAVHFFHRQGVKGTRAEIERACDAFGYHPLCLRLLSGMVVEDLQSAGDVSAWTKHNPLPHLKGEKKEHHILELAYDSLEKKKKTLISNLSAFRNAMTYDGISVFKEFGKEQEFDKALIELAGRGLLLRDAESNTYDLHPVLRRYCYDRLKGKAAIHSQLQDYFSAVPKPETVESLDDLTPLIELYYHTARSGKYDEAFELFQKRVSKPTHYQFGAHNLRVCLLRALFPDGEDRRPSLSKESDQAWTLNALGNSYSLSGQPKKALPLFERLIEFQETAIDRERIPVVLAALAVAIQIPLGELQRAESNLRRSIDLSLETKNERTEAMGHSDLGLLLAYRGKFEESEKELATAIQMRQRLKHHQPEGVAWLHRSLRALFLPDAEGALKAAEKARKLADVSHSQQDIIRAEWLLGAAHLARGDLSEAEVHLCEALMRDRRIDLVIVEPDILLELAKLRFAQARKEETLKLAGDALAVANRCEYRLQQADIRNFLGKFYLAARDFSKAEEHVEIAKERAACGYKPAMDKAEELWRQIGKESSHK